jgi:hypothetical protein
MVNVRLLASLLLAAGCDHSSEAPAAGSAAPPAPAAPPTTADVRTSCDAIRDMYFAWRAAAFERALQSGVGENDILEQQRKALEAAKPTFVETCTSTGIVMDPQCLKTPLGELPRPDRQRCRTMINALADKLWPSSRSSAMIVSSLCGRHAKAEPIIVAERSPGTCSGGGAANGTRGKLGLAKSGRAWSQ